MAHSAHPDAVAALPPAPAGLYVGTSGWAYPTWKPGFYPPRLPARSFLAHYASRLNSVEVNYTFRQLPTPAMLDGWLAAVPPGFRFSFKAPQRITHFSRLRDTDDQVAAFVHALLPAAHAGKLGLLLFQLPPNCKADPARLRTFLTAPALNDPANPLRLAFEFRHDSWFNPDTYAILREHRSAALCIADGDDLATPDVHTALTHTSFRLRRDGGYTPAELAAFSQRMSELAAAGREVYTYLRHQEEPTGALNATALLSAAN